jgi:Flp pilus assembly protein TadG
MKMRGRTLLSRWVGRPGALERGQGLVEFTLVVVFLIVLFGGAVQLGLMYLVHMSLRDASQEGAAYGSFDPTNTAGIESRVREALAGTIDPASVTVTVTETNPGMFCASIDPATLRSNGIRVEVYYELPIIVPFLGAVLGGDSIPLLAMADDTILAPPC